MLNELYSINDGLKSEKYLGNIIIFLKDKHQESNTFNNKINSYLDVTLYTSRQIRLTNLRSRSAMKPRHPYSPTLAGWSRSRPRRI
jgi:hypothetical protein